MIREVQKKDIPEIAKLHIESYKGHFLKKLGIDLLSSYYREFLESGSIFLLNLDGNQEINGFILGVINSNEIREKFIKKNKLKLFFKFFLLILKLDSQAWLRVLRRIKNYLGKSRNNKQRENKVIYTLLSICVRDDVKGKKVSLKLIKKLEEKIMTRGVDNYRLTVYIKNKRAVQFYKKIGMTINNKNKQEYEFIKKIK